MKKFLNFGAWILLTYGLAYVYQFKDSWWGSWSFVLGIFIAVFWAMYVYKLFIDDLI